MLELRRNVRVDSGVCVAEARELDELVASEASHKLVWSRGGGAHGGVHSEMPTGAVPIRISFARL